VGEDSSNKSTPMADLYGSPELRGFIFNRLQSRADADDVLHETVARVLDRIRFHKIDAPLAYAIRIAQNLIRDLQRNRVSFLEDTSVEIRSEAPLQDEALGGRERMALFLEVLDGMPPLRRKVFLMRRLDGLTHGEIALHLGLSTHAVEKHVVRALSELRDVMTAHDGPRS